MGIPFGGAVDSASRFRTGSLTGTGAGAWTESLRGLNVSLWGTFSATVTLERSFDGGATAIPVSCDTFGTPASFTASASLAIQDGEPGVLYRWNCTSYTSGTVNWRMSE